MNWDSLALDWDSRFFTRRVRGRTITICNKIAAFFNSLRDNHTLQTLFTVTFVMFSLKCTSHGGRLREVVALGYSTILLFVDDTARHYSQNMKQLEEYKVEPRVSNHQKCQDFVVAYENRTTGESLPRRGPNIPIFGRKFFACNL